MVKKRNKEVHMLSNIIVGTIIELRLTKVLTVLSILSNN